MLGSTQTNALNGVEALRVYRSEYNERHSVLRPRPVHDWTSHCADAFQMAAIAADFAGAGTRDSNFNRRLKMPAILVI